jgi:hypothetical protein
MCSAAAAVTRAAWHGQIERRPACQRRWLAAASHEDAATSQQLRLIALVVGCCGSGGVRASRPITGPTQSRASIRREPCRKHPQIDGVVEIDGHLYLVEMKWWVSTWAPATWPSTRCG